MRNERGFTLLELLVATLSAGIVILGLASLYLATTGAFAQSASQASLQRQGTLTLDQVSQVIRRGNTLTTGCAPAGTTGGSVGVTVTTVPALPTLDGFYCYYAGNGANGAPAGAFCQQWTPTGGVAQGCRDLLGANQPEIVRQGRLTGVTLLQQPAAPDPRCPPVGAGQFCLTLAQPAGTNSVDIAFAVTDGLNALTFSVSLALRN
jgi:type II secretory pathway pseudopilin PulG